MDLGLVDKVVLITGAGGGIGQALARAFAAEGAKLALSDVRLDAVESSVAALRASGRAACATRCDVSDEADVDRMVDEVTAAFGPIDVLVNNAGIFHGQSIADLSVRAFDQLMAINTRGVFLCSKAVLRGMVQRRSGKIVSLASLAGQVGGIIAGIDYAASKAAVATMTKSIAKYAGPYGINVNCVNPGVIDTPMTVPWGEETRERMRQQIPLARLGTADDVARVIVFLASDAAAYIHGAHVDINGGLHMD